ncbi:MAG: CDP-diacylglycerol--serine O-phosphatidyltransferase, partial [Tidjanibacter sp.]|nr:CDP-diacylglycerol--serine O-phosphatidyltransferase [Tidjanibacter sp.]
PIGMFSLKFKGFSLKNPANRLRYAFLLLAAAILIIGGLGCAWVVIILYVLTSIVNTLLAAAKNNK